MAKLKLSEQVVPPGHRMCAKCHHILPTKDYEHEDKFGRLKLRVNCSSCRLKRQVTDQRRYERKRAEKLRHDNESSASTAASPYPSPSLSGLSEQPKGAATPVTTPPEQTLTAGNAGDMASSDVSPGTNLQVLPDRLEWPSLSVQLLEQLPPEQYIKAVRYILSLHDEAAQGAEPSNAETMAGPSTETSFGRSEPPAPLPYMHPPLTSHQRTNLELDTLEKWESAMDKCPHLRGLSEEDRDSLLRKREAAAVLGLTEVPESVSKQPALGGVYPMSHLDLVTVNADGEEEAALV